MLRDHKKIYPKHLFSFSADNILDLERRCLKTYCDLFRTNWIWQMDWNLFLKQLSSTSVGFWFFWVFFNWEKNENIFFLAVCFQHSGNIHHDCVLNFILILNFFIFNFFFNDTVINPMSLWWLCSLYYRCCCQDWLVLFHGRGPFHLWWVPELL